MLGETLGLYKLIEEIGSGGFGTVYMARYQRTNEIVAIKVLRPELSSRPDFGARFEHEAQTLRALPLHPNIVGLRDFGDVHGQPYIVMDYLAGLDLRNHLEEGPLPIQRAVAVAAQVADALDAAARGGLVHCDIKPENVKLLPDGTVMVMDFGIARAADTSFREIAGTPTYMGPELWRGLLPEPATDIYALGCLLYEMLTGRPPFVSSIRGDRVRARQEVAQLHQTTEPDWARLQQAVVPPGLLALLRAMLAKEPQERPTALGVAQQLRQLQGAIAAEARLTCEAVEVDEEATLADPELTVVRSTSTPSAGYLTPQVSTPAFIPDGAHVVVQRHLTSAIELGAEACRAALARDWSFYTGTMAGQICRLDLRTGRIERWDASGLAAVRSPVWAFVAHHDRLLFHMGDVDLLEAETGTGLVRRRGRLPEKEMSLAVVGEWLYMAGAQTRLYRAPLSDPERQEAFELGGRLTGAPWATPKAVYAPTRAGLVWLDPATRQARPLGPQQTARAVVGMQQGAWLAVLYSVVTGGTQSGWLRLFDGEATPPRLLAEVELAGQSTGPPQTAARRILVASRNGRVMAWDVTQEEPGGWALNPAWPQPVEVGAGVQGGSLSGGLLALAVDAKDTSRLVTLNAAGGQKICEEPLAGAVFTAPLWWERTLALVAASGVVEVFRATLVT